MFPPERAQKDAPVANRLVHQFRSDRAIDTATDGTYNSTILSADLADASDFLPYKLLLQRRNGVIVSSHPDMGQHNRF